jgi:hypothetical protein
VYSKNNLKKTYYTGCVADSIYDLVKDPNLEDSLSIISCYVSTGGGFYCEKCSDSEWFPYKMDSTEYDSSGNIIKQISLVYDLLRKEWINEYKYDYSFNSSGEITSLIHCIWDTIDNSWVNLSKLNFQFDLNGNEIEVRDSVWDTVNKVWLADMGYIQIFNSINQLLVFESSSYSSNQLYRMARSELNYTDQNDLKERLRFIKLNVDDDWQKVIRTVNYWSYERNGILQMDYKEKTINVFPNPFSNLITIAANKNEDIKSYTIYDCNGIEVHTENAKGNKVTMNTSHFKSGVYLLKIKLQNSTVIERVVKK